MDRVDRDEAVDLLVGREAATVGQFVVFGVALAALVALLAGAVHLGRVFGADSMAESGRLILLAICGLAVLAAGAHGLLNGGFLVGVVVAVSPRAGVELFRAAAPAFDSSVPGVPIAGAAGTTLVAAAAGTLLAVTGIAARYLVEERGDDAAAGREG